MHLYTPCNYQGTPPVPISSVPSYSHSLRGNHLPAKSQLVGHTVSTEALATDAITVVAKCDLHVSIYWPIVCSSLRVFSLYIWVHIHIVVLI